MRKLGVTARAKKKAPAGHKRPAPPSPTLQPASPFQIVLRAASFAARKHHGQTRADKQTPYFSHVARVTLILTHVFGVQDEEILAIALLHDTLEDTATDYDELAATFGERIADGVVILTKNVMLPKKAREEDYARRLRRASEDIMIAKMADIYDNLSDRVHTPKLFKTAETAERLLREFAERLGTPTGLAAHEKLSQLLEEVKTLQAAETTSVVSGMVAE